MVQWHVKRSFPPIVVAMATVTLATSPGPDDPRYPDYIVTPRVECVEKGVFPHPRNCSWFYRCQDIIRKGFFSTEYFQCEPGTVFSDERDQCLYAANVRPPCGTNPGPGPTPQPGGPTPQPGGPTPQPGGPTPQPGEPTPQPGGPTPQPGGPTPQPGGPTPQPGGPTPQPGGPTPQPGGPTPQPGEPTPQPGEPTPQPGGGSAITNFCSFNDTVCKKYEVCEPTRETLNLCSGCYISNTFVNASIICSQTGHVLDRAEKTCVSPPEESSLCQPTLGPPGIPVTITSNNSIDCSDDNLRPEESWIINRYCEDYVLCNADTSFLGIRKLCSNYFECHREPDGSWDFEMKSCDEGQMYSYKEEACVSKPLDSELCTNMTP